MTPKDLRQAEKLLADRRATKQLLADTLKMSVYALELRLPARDGRIFVFSNEQPGAQRECTPGMNGLICEAVSVGLAAEIAELGDQLTTLGIDVAAADAEDSEQAGE